VHHTTIVGQKKKVVHLCQGCAEKKQLVTKQNELNLQAIVQSLIGQHIDDELARLTCPACGIKYMEFRAEGRLGCPHDYNVFRNPLQALVQRIHRAGRHVGKTPSRRPLSDGRQLELAELRRRVRDAVEREAYEEAARLRDLLREKEATDECG
jgi:protein arginine kinase activator